MAEQDNIKIVRKLFDHLNNHDLKAGDQFVANDFRVEATGVSGTLNKDQNNTYTQTYIQAFPDLRFRIKDVIAQGNKVVATWVAEGTHNNALQVPSGESIPATRKKVTVPGCTFYEFNASNLINRQEIYWDQGTMLMQLGVMQAMANRSSSTR